MDPISHVAWGIVATNLLPEPDAMLPRIVIASVAAAAPDFDFVTKFFKNIYFLKYHHSVTHSLVGVSVMGLAIAFLGRLAFPEIAFGEAYLVALVAGVSHCVLDLIMHGTGAMVLWPFSRRMITASLLLGLNPTTTHARCHEKSLRVCLVCQLHSAMMCPMTWLGLLAAAASVFAGSFRQIVALAGAVLGVSYMLMCYLMKKKSRRVASRIVPEATKVLAFPAGFSPFQWLVVCQTSLGFRLLWLHSRDSRPRATRAIPPVASSAAIDRSRSTKTVREFLSACVIPWVFQTKDGDTVRVQWQDLSYALSSSMDLYAARITMRRDLSVIDEDFRERWPDLWQPGYLMGEDAVEGREAS